MEQSLMDVADELAREFDDLDQGVVMRALCDCLRIDPHAPAAVARRAAYRRLEDLCAASRQWSRPNGGGSVAPLA